MTLASKYRTVQVETASKERLMMLLFDAACANMKKGREALKTNQRHAAFDSIERASKIVIELNSTLRDDLAPELTETLHDVYDFVIGRLIRASVGLDLKMLDEAERVFTPIRDAFAQACVQVANQPAPQPAAASARP